MIPHELHYAFPSAAWLFPISLILLGCMFFLFSYRRKIASYYGHKRYREKILPSRSRLYTAMYAIAILLTWLLAVLALMQPQGKVSRKKNSDKSGKIIEQVLSEEKEERGLFAERRRKAHDLIFILDTSASMSVTDTPQGISRLQYAKEIIDEITASADGAAAGLYVFTSEVTPLVPPTYDTLFFRLLLRNVSINEGGVAGTDLAKTLEEVAGRYLKKSKDKRVTLVLLTDGGDTRLETLSGGEREQEIKAISSRMEGIDDLPIRLFTIGMGTAKGAVIPGIVFDNKPVVSTLDDSLLQQLAEKGKGRYFFSNQMSALSIAQSLQKILSQDEPFIKEESIEVREGKIERTIEQSSEVVYKPYFQWPLGLSVLFLGIALLLPEKRRKSAALFCIFFSTVCLQAETIPQQWREAASFYEAGDYSEALVHYDAILKENLTHLEKITAELNRAHVLEMAGRFDESVEQLKKIKIDPSAPDSLQNTYRLHLAANLLHRARATSDLDQGINDAIEAIALLKEVQEQNKNKENHKKLQEENLFQIEFAKKILYDIRFRKEQKQLQEAGISELASILGLQIMQTMPRIEALLPLPHSVSVEQGNFYASHFQRTINYLDAIREKVYASLKKEESYGLKFVFDPSETSYRSGIDALKEGSIRQARSFFGKARLGFGFTQRVAGEGVEDPINWLLTERITAWQKKNKESPTSIFFAEDEKFAKDLTQGIIGQLAIEEKNPWRAAQFNYLLEQMKKEIDDPFFNQVFYQAIGMEEEQQIVFLHKIALSLPADQPLSENQWSTFLRHLEVTDQILQLRETQGNTEKKFGEMRDILQERKGWVVPLTGQRVTDFLERVLLAGDPRTFLLARIKKLEAKGLALQKAKEVKIISLNQHKEQIASLQHTPIDLEDPEEWDQIKKYLESAEKSEERAIVAYPDKPELTQFFLLDALDFLQDARELLEPLGKEPQEVLQDAIKRQEAVQKRGKELPIIPLPALSAVNKVFLQQQERVLSSIDRFSIPEEKDGAIPWEKVDDLAKQGRREAAELSLSIKKEGRNQKTIEKFSSSAITYWKQALKLLENPSKENNEPPSSEEDSSNSEGPQKENPQNSNLSEEKQGPDEQLLQAIQQMEQEDASLFDEEKREPKRGLRPW